MIAKSLASLNPTSHLARPGRRRTYDGDQLTATQEQIMQLLSDGCRTYADVAQRRGVTTKTAQSQMGEIFMRLGVHSKAEALEKWRRIK